MACSINGQKAKERRAQRLKMLANIEKAAHNYESLSAGSRHRKGGWRKYVMEATGTSQKFLTLIIRSGEITAPREVSDFVEFFSGAAMSGWYKFKHQGLVIRGIRGD